MKSLVAILAFLCSSAFAQTWQKSTEIYTNPANPKEPIAIFVNSVSGAGQSSGVWHQVDLKPYGVAFDAKSAMLSGVLIITHGSAPQTCDLTVSFRAVGNNLAAGNYIGQTIETAVGAGQRSTMATFVPLNNGIFEFQWNRNTTGQWPTECAYGINLSLQAWTK